MVFLDKPIFVGSKRQIEPYICTSPNIYFKKKKKESSCCTLFWTYILQVYKLA